MKSVSRSVLTFLGLLLAGGLVALLIVPALANNDDYGIASGGKPQQQQSPFPTEIAITVTHQDLGGAPAATATRQPPPTDTPVPPTAVPATAVPATDVPTPKPTVAVFATPTIGHPVGG